MRDKSYRIAFFTNSYHPVVNGVVRSIAAFRDALTRLGHNVFIFAQADSEYQDPEPFIFRYPSLSLPLAMDVTAAIPVSPFVDQLLPALKPDVIHAHHPFLLGQTAARKASELEVPLVFTFHTKYWEYTHYVPFPQEAIQEFLKNAVHNWLKDYMRKCHHVVIPSNSLKESLVRRYGLEDGYSVIPTGIDLKPFQEADGKAVRSRLGWRDEKVIVSIGRLASEKNWPMLLRAVAMVCARRSKVRLLLIGDGPQRPELEQLALELGIGDRVCFAGQVPFEQVPAYLKAGDLFCFSSITETQGLVTIEAMAAGLPVVAVDASGTRDIVEDGKQGFLVPDDAERLAWAMNRLLSDKNMMRLFGARGLHKAKTHDMQRLSSQLLSVYEQAIEARREGRYVTLSPEKAEN